jgi:hypothetical protein
LILLAELALDHPDLVALTTRLCTITELTRVLRALVREGIPIRDLRTILEQLVLQEVGTVIDFDDDRPGDDGLASIQQLTGRIRRGLRSAISGQFAGRHHRLLALRTDPEFQRRAIALLRSAEPSEEAREQLLDELWEAVQQASRAGVHPVVITSDGARWAVRCLIDSELPEFSVLAESEIRNDIELVLLPWTEARMTVEYLVQVAQVRPLGQRHHRDLPGTCPACDTRCGSSNVARIFASSCNNRTCEMSSQPDDNSHRPSSEGIYTLTRPNASLFMRWIEA